MLHPLSIVPPKKKPKHVVIPGKQHIIGVDGVDDVEAYNKCDQMPLFTDLLLRRRILINSHLYVCETLFMYPCETTFMYVCETTFMYVCETTFMYVCETTFLNALSNAKKN